MKALTVQQPWAWCIFHGKPVENRTQLWTHRGPLAIHAGARLSERGCELVPDLLDAHHPEVLADYTQTQLTYSAIIGMVNVLEVHLEHEGCCDSPWAETSYVEHGGRTRRQLTHLVLEEPVELDEPVPCKGALGLWTVPDDVEAQVALQIVEAVSRG